MTAGVDDVHVVRCAENSRQSRSEATHRIVVPRLRRLEEPPAFGRERCRLRLEIVDRHSPFEVVAPRARDIDRVGPAFAVAVVLVGARNDRIARRRGRTAAGRHDAAIGRHDLADLELLRTVAAQGARSGDAIADTQRICGPVLPQEIRDVAALKLPVLARAVRVRHREPIAHVRVREPDLGDLAFELRALRSVEFRSDRVMRRCHWREEQRHD